MEISVSAFYPIPAVLTAWFAGSRAAVAMAALAALTQLATRIAGEPALDNAQHVCQTCNASAGAHEALRRYALHASDGEKGCDERLALDRREIQQGRRRRQRN